MRDKYVSSHVFRINKIGSGKSTDAVAVQRFRGVDCCVQCSLNCSCDITSRREHSYQVAPVANKSGTAYLSLLIVLCRLE